MSLDIKIGSYQFGNYIEEFEIQQDSRVEMVAIPRRHGYLSDTGYKTGMSIRIAGLIYDDDYNVTRTIFNSLKSAISAGKVTFTVFSDRQVTVQKSYFSSSYEDQDLRRIRWEAELMSDDFGFVAVSPTVDESIITESPQSESVTNNGNLETYPVIRITAGTSPIASGLRIDNLTSGKYFTFNEAIPAGDYIEIDTDLLTVVNSSGTNKLTYFSGDFFKIEPGDNSILWTGSYAIEGIAIETGDALLLEDGSGVGGEDNHKLKITFRDKHDGH